jgi:hypothetical protein
VENATKRIPFPIAHLLVQLAFGKTLVVALVPGIFRRQAGSRGGGRAETAKHFATAGMDVPAKHSAVKQLPPF